MRVVTKVILICILLLTIFITACTLTGSTVIDECSGLEGGARDECYLELNQCSKISLAQTRDLCVTELAVMKNDAAVCDLVKSDSAKGNCQYKLAVQQENSEVCSEISDVYWSDNCNYYFATNDEAYEFCHLIQDYEQKVDCFDEVAKSTGDYLLCGFLGEKDKTDCLYGVALEIASAEPCDNIADSFGADVCRLRVAKKHNISEICPTIGFFDIKKTCTDYFVESN